MTRTASRIKSLALAGAAALAMAPAQAARRPAWSERGFLLMYADSMRLQNDFEDTRIKYAFAAYRLAAPLDGAERFHFVLEPRLGWFIAPEHGRSPVGGMDMLLEWRLAPGRRLTPYCEAMAGGMFTDIPGLDGPFNFSLGLGAGLRWELDGRFLLAGYRLHHISSDGIYGKSNIGINASMPFVGLAWPI